MSKEKISNNDLKSLGITDIKSLKLFGRTAKKLKIKHSKAEITYIFRKLLADPESFLDAGEELKTLAESVLQKKNEIIPRISGQEVQLRPDPIEYTIYGKENIDSDAIKQMDTAMRLLVAEAGALMPDAHTGYGLPIGGVLATQSNVVIPYAVGVDIACRMCMTVYDAPAESIQSMKDKLISALIDNTVFGVGEKCFSHFNSSIFDHPGWNSTNIIRRHRDLAYSQLGTSGAGNHFVEWGVLEISEPAENLDLKKGQYLALLSHSGSRGFGSEIASYYSKIAMQQVKLPQIAKHLAWLNLDSEEGQEYWIAMNMAGLYASANHHEIHDKITHFLGFQSLLSLENHHNFAWKSVLPGGKQVIVHRKGATPAGSNDIGIIPGSMTLPGYVIRGKGNPQSINSASHGAGRIMSRNQAFKNFSFDEMQKQLQKNNVELIGGDIDEAPMVYKDIETVMGAQSNLVDVLAKFYPKIVRMADPERRRRRKL